MTQSTMSKPVMIAGLQKAALTIHAVGQTLKEPVQQETMALVVAINEAINFIRAAP